MELADHRTMADADVAARIAYLALQGSRVFLGPKEAYQRGWETPDVPRHIVRSLLDDGRLRRGPEAPAGGISGPGVYLLSNAPGAYLRDDRL